MLFSSNKVELARNTEAKSLKEVSHMIHLLKSL